jgi:hypothetical protein
MVSSEMSLKEYLKKKLFLLDGSQYLDGVEGTGRVVYFRDDCGNELDTWAPSHVIEPFLTKEGKYDCVYLRNGKLAPPPM